MQMEIPERTAGGPAPLAPAPDMSGLDFLRAIAAGGQGAPIAELLEFRPDEIEHGRVVFVGAPDRRHYNPIGAVHGGYLATLLDSAMGCAVHSTLPAGRGYTTVELKVNYVRPLTDRTGPVRAEGKVVHVGGRVATAEGRVVDAAGKLYAHGTTTCLVFSL